MHAYTSRGVQGFVVYTDVGNPERSDKVDGPLWLQGLEGLEYLVLV